MEQILTDYAPWIAAGTALVVLAEKIAKITPTNADNIAVNWIYKIFSVIGINVKDRKS
tara:strand:- start:4633 stop:4806 length:174 start_codon:yes stop_codon:yes gene_type:complete